ncbi:MULTISPECIES: hypothetical protein [Acinetobacter]|nr:MULTISPECIES: hypothetical protein [Acinetobacter]ENX31552.1 hypothetical protein F890_00744 [Acinetobacter sp. CIP 64.7]QGR73865.1 hypothetical protein FOB21_03735 [Acinetobacter lwoffii]QKT99893.1 hypothetical protein FOB20_14660 [Acinetobacter lwoffii]
MKIENIIERMLDHEFFDQDYQNAIAQHLKPTVLIPELKPLLKTTVSFDADSKFELPTKLPLPPSVSKHPICAYLYSVDQHEYPIIQRWAVHNLHAACILKAIPNPTEKDHQTTIIRVFNRFRLANEAYAASQQGKQLNRYQQEYLWLWEQLPSHEITLADFVKSLRELENDSKLNRFQYLLLLDIRRFYDYVLALKPKKHYSAPPKHIDEPIYLDEHNAILHCPYDMPQKQHPALFYEELQDEQPNQQYSINTAQVSPLTSQSSLLQHRVSKLTQQHIIRQQHNFSCSKHYPDFNSLSLLVQHCHQLYLNHQKKNKAYLFILLSFLSGVPIEQWLYLQSKQRYALNKRQKVIFENDQYFLRSKFTLFEDSAFEYKDQLLNQVTHFDLPLVKELVEGLRQQPILKQEQVAHALKKCREELFIPSLSTKKISVLLHHCIYHYTQNEQLADILTGIDANRSVSISYCSYPIYRLQQSYQGTVHQLSKDLAKEIYVIDDEQQRFGSCKAPKPAIVTAIFAYLQHQIIQAEHQGKMLDMFNHYNVWLWHILLLFSAARPVSDFPGFLKNFDLKQQWLWLSDKEIHSRTNDGRLIPLCDFVVKQIRLFITYLNEFQQLYPEHQPYIQEILSSKKPLLSVYQHGQWQALSPHLVNSFTRIMQLDHANWLRHTARAYLTEQADENFILALFGHEQNQQEMGQKFSSLSLQQYKELANCLNNMQHAYQIDGMYEHA